MNNITKNLFSLMLLFLGSMSLSAQCDNGIAWGSAAITSTCPVTMTTCNFYGEYATATGIVAGGMYSFTTDEPSAYITVRQATTNVVIGSGLQPLTITAAIAGNLEIHVNLDATCATTPSPGCIATSGTCLSCLPPPPTGPGTSCADAIALAFDATGLAATTGTTVGGCANPSMPFCTTDLSTAPGRWFSVTPTANTSLTVSLCGSAYDTKLGVFSGTCAGLVCVAGNDDFCGLQSQLVMAATTGTTYYIYVTGFSTGAGAFTLNVQADACSVAAPLALTVSPLNAGPICPNETVDFTSTLTGGVPLSANYSPYVGFSARTNELVEFNPSAMTGTITDLVTPGGYLAGGVINNQLYVVDPFANRLDIINKSTGAVTNGPLLTGAVLPAQSSLALVENPADGLVYGMFATAAGTQVFTVDIVTGAMTLVVTLNGGPVGGIPVWIVFDETGKAYSLDILDDVIYDVNMTTGLMTPLFATGLATNFAQTAFYDPSTSNIYACIYTGAGTGGIYTVDKVTGQTTLVYNTLPVGPFGIELTAAGFFEPEQAFSWTPVDGNLSCYDCPNPTFTAPATVGTYTYTVTAKDDCGSEVMETVSVIVAYDITALACNDHVNVSVDQVCSGTVMPDMILEGALQCSEQAYTVRIKNGNTILPNPSNWAQYLNQNLVAEVIDPVGQVACWGYITFEDNLPPVITGSGQTTLINCGEVNGIIANKNAGRPTASNVQDNCGVNLDWILTIDYHQSFGATDCETVIVRQWEAKYTDKSGNVVTLYYARQWQSRPLDVTTIVAPTTVVSLTCGADTDPASLPAAADRYPRIGSTALVPGVAVCNVYSSYEDLVIDACGTGCNGNKKIIRTWTLLNWCDGTVLPPLVQIIKAVDAEGPTFTVRDTAVSTRPWDCLADFVLPGVWELHDNCDSNPTYYITGPGVVAPNTATNPTNNWIVRGASKGDHIYIYYGVDCCGNETPYIINVTVSDRVAPVVTTKQDIVVSLTPAGPGYESSAKLFGYHFDNGSYDACTDVKVEIRRPAGAPNCSNVGANGHNNNITFNNDGHADDANNDTDNGEFVKFCCDDVNAEVIDVNGDGVNDKGYVEVIIRVWDDADMDGVFGSAGDNYNEAWSYVKVEDNTPPIIACPDDATIYCDWPIDDNFATNNANIRRRSQTGNIQGWKSVDGVDFSKTGVATAYSTCGVEAVEFVDVIFDEAPDFDQLSQCGEGTYTRVFRVTKTTKTGPKVQYCYQKINVLVRNYVFDVQYRDNNNNGQIDPADQGPFTVTCSGPTTADLAKYGPVVTSGGCVPVGENVKIDTFLFEGGVCKKWIATYNYTEWCRGANAGPFTIEFMYFDTEKPVITCQDTMYAVDANCEAVLTVSKSATDNGGCIEGGWLKWQVFVDTWADGGVNHYGSSFVNPTTYRNWKEVANTDPVLPTGTVYNATVWVKYIAPTSSGEAFTLTMDKEVLQGNMSNHKVAYKVTDGCHNYSTCSENIMIVDKKAPTPYCVSLSSALMANGQVELWARDFDKGSFDQCTAQEDLLFTFNEMHPTLTKLNEEHYFTGAGVASTKAKYDAGEAQKWVPSFKSSAKIFDCDELNAQGPNGVPVKMSVWDEKLNTDYCVVYLTLVDNQGGCETGGGSRVAGNVTTEANDDLVDVVVTIEGNVNDLTRVQTVSGNYDFANLPLGVDYEVTAAKDVDYMNGVSTLDLVMIQRHILGLQELNSAYKLIAADVNNDMNIRANDLVELRKLILGVTNDFTATSWKLVDASEVLTMTTPLQYNEVVYVDNLQGDVTNANFMAVKVGDVNGNAKANIRNNNSEPRSGNTITLQAEEQVIVAGENVSVAITSANFNEVFGYQFTTELNGLSLNGVRSGAIEMTDANIGVPTSNVMTASWISENLATVNANEVLFTLDFTATKAGNLSEMMNITSSVTRAESYTGAAMNVSDLELTFRTETATTANYALLQNEPNPFKASTTVGFEMAAAGQATFKLYDVTGKVLVVRNIEAVKGLNTVEFTSNEIKASGIVYYQIESGDFTATKKMIIIE